MTIQRKLFGKFLAVLPVFNVSPFTQQFNSERQIEVDPLEFLKKWGSDIFQTKNEKLWLKYNIFGLFLHLLLHIVYFFSIKSASEFLDYVLVFCVSVYVKHNELKTKKSAKLNSELFQAINVQITLIINYNLIENVPKDLDVWTQVTTVETFQKIQKNIRKSTLYGMVGMMVAVLSGMSVGIMDKTTKRLFLLVKECEVFLPDLTNTIVNYLRVMFVYHFYTMTVHAFQLIYLGQHINIQMELLIERAKRINNDRNILVLCIKRYTHISKFVEKKSLHVGFMLVTFVFTGGLIGIGVGLYAFEGVVEATYVTYLQVVLTSSLFLNTFAGIIHSGQMVENQVRISHIGILGCTVQTYGITADHSKIFQPEKLAVAILSNPWYEWDVTMQRDLVIFLGKIMKPLRISYLEYLGINYKLGLTIMRTVYSVLSVMLRLKYR